MIVALIIAFALMMFLAGVLIIIEPKHSLRTLSQRKNELLVYIAAVAVRLVIGVSLVVKARESGFPVTVEAIGYLFIIAAVLLSLIGHGQFIRLISWVLNRLSAYARIGGFFAILFGGFLLYAFV